MTDAMQPSLFDDVTSRSGAGSPAHVVNVASVPQRSPFRYPGGKTWLVPKIRQWFRSLPLRSAHLIEPFAGGGIAGLTVAFEGLADHVTFVELDADVAAVWQAILEGDGQWLAEQILAFEPSHEHVRAVLSDEPTSVPSRAFATIVKNRVNHGGILAPGSGILKYGENGKGLTSRWYPQTLARRILSIAAIRDRFSIICGDGIAVMREYANRADTVFFIDPPYTVGGKRAGSRLYTHWELNHPYLFDVAETLLGDFLMTYDNVPDLHALAGAHRFDTLQIAMKNTHHTTMTELLIGRNLDWAR